MLWDDDVFDWVSKNALDRSGGLLLVWRRGCFSLSSVFQGENFIGIEGFWGVDRVQVTMVNVYAPCDLRGKRQLCG